MNYADVDHKGGGVVHFNNREGMDYALRKLDGSEFSNRYDTATISVSKIFSFFLGGRFYIFIFPGIGHGVRTVNSVFLPEA